MITDLLVHIQCDRITIQNYLMFGIFHYIGMYVMMLVGVQRSRLWHFSYSIFYFTLYYISFSTSHFILLAISLSTSSRCEMPCVKPRASHTVTNGMGVVPFSGEGSIDDQRHHIATPLLLLWLYFPSFSYFNLSQLFIIYPSLVFISYGCQHYANPDCRWY